MRLKKINLLKVAFIVSFVTNQSFAASNVVFLNNPSPQHVEDIGNFVVKRTEKPFFSDVILFAANINSNASKNPVLFYNDEISSILKGNISLVHNLQKKGIRVQLSYLGNHQNAGWSCNMSKETATALANEMVDDVVKYGLDGVNIDDEYSRCSGNPQSFYWVADAIKSHPNFAKKVLTKALWSDSIYFKEPTNIANLLDAGYEMTYAGNVNSLARYVNFGMRKENLLLGVSPEKNSVSSVQKITRSVINKGYDGMMVWSPNTFFTNSQASQYYTAIIKAEEGVNEEVVYVPDTRKDNAKE
ncbi:hypothetical protein BB987_03200 [Photorhabdus temperata]|uniref:Glycosyl hydrolase family 18 n=1 Tax=Photorhabdus khanii NC19 TaxID=1004151 RepID=W3V4F0_9GAMM|nr:glycosyl hydrolase family 18 protein [Photorhabdus khanii]ETS30816.1 glycosyl hydrolase family 18 [Photorhabdus khanii NC19]OHV49187.1 hypothetical protein BB987_03200 [Photorhabdus temperata]